MKLRATSIENMNQRGTPQELVAFSGVDIRLGTNGVHSLTLAAPLGTFRLGQEIEVTITEMEQ